MKYWRALYFVVRTSNLVPSSTGLEFPLAFAFGLSSSVPGSNLS